MYIDNDEKILVTIVFIYLAVLAAMLLIYLAGYILQGVGMYTMGKRKGKQHAWLAFIPYARVYFQGELAGPIQLKNKQIKTPGLWMLLIPIITGMGGSLIWGFVWSGMISSAFVSQLQYGLYDGGMDMGNLFNGSGVVVFIVGMILYMIVLMGVGAITSTLYVLVNRQVYKECTTDGMATAHAVLGLFIPLYPAICYFVFRNRIPDMAPPMNYGPYSQGPINTPVNQSMDGPTTPPM